MGRLPTTTNGKEAVTVKSMVARPDMVQRFSDVLGGRDKANQFLASVVSAVNGNNNLAKCNPVEVLACAMIAASLNLDVNPNLGFASIVPYKKKWKDVKTGKWNEVQIPQFQMGWKGYVQLAMRTGKYRSMNVTEVYRDEFDSYDPFKGELHYHLVADGDRAHNRLENVVGYAFYFELVSGFEKMAYLSKEEAEAHALQFSKAYQYDKKEGKETSPWSTMFDKMAEKTIVKNTLSKWGVLSTQMITAAKADQATVRKIDAKETDYEYVDNEPMPKAVDKISSAEEVPADTPEAVEQAFDNAAAPENFEDSPFPEEDDYPDMPDYEEPAEF